MAYEKSTNIDPTKATFGTQGADVLALQKQLNLQNKGVTGYTPLKEDALYGPLTQAATQFKVPTMASTNPLANTNQSTTALSSVNPATKIPAIVNTFNTLSGRGITTQTDTEGNNISTYADGTVYNPSTDPIKADTSKEEGTITTDYESRKTQTDAMTASAITSIQNRYKELKAQQKKVNESQLGATTNALITSGAAQHDVFSNDNIKLRMEQGNQALADLDNEEADLINTAKAAQLSNNFKLLDAKNAEIQKVRDAKALVTKGINDYLIEATKENRKIEKENNKQNKIVELYNEGITDIVDILAKLKESGIKDATIKEVGDAVGLLSGVGGTGIVGEYNFYKSEAKKAGQTPVDFNTYQDMDTNRKKIVAKAGVAETIGESGILYSPQQEKIIVRVDREVSNNPTYKRTASMRGFAQNVESALSQGTGTGDIAAINQFQKVIDEGAVTRDQDVKLIQGAQSLVDKLMTKIKNLQQGDQLSPTLRREMVKTTQDILKAQEKAIGKDSFIQSKKNELKRNNINYTDSILGELEEQQNIGDELIASEADAENKINTSLIILKDTNPTLWKTVSDMYISVNEETGQPYSALDILQAFPELN